MHMFILETVCLDTTDVQRATVSSTDDDSLFRVQCDFMTGSDAQGCMVVLVGDFNATLNLTRPENYSVASVMYMISCLNEVLAFDIERDGSIGPLAVHGKIFDNTSTLGVNVECSPKFSDKHCM